VKINTRKNWKASGEYPGKSVAAGDCSSSGISHNVAGARKDANGGEIEKVTKVPKAVRETEVTGGKSDEEANGRIPRPS